MLRFVFVFGLLLLLLLLLMFAMEDRLLAADADSANSNPLPFRQLALQVEQNARTGQTEQTEQTTPDGQGTYAAPYLLPKVTNVFPFISSPFQSTLPFQTPSRFQTAAQFQVASRFRPAPISREGLIFCNCHCDCDYLLKDPTDVVCVPMDGQSQNPTGDPNYYRFPDHFIHEWNGFVGDILQDYRNYYSWDTGFKLLVAIGVAAPFANTRLDMDFYYWYEDHVRSSTTDKIASFWKFFGEGVYMAPITLGVTLTALLLNEKMGWLDQVGGEYCKNVFRAYAVGAPPMFLLQAMLGGDRPENGDTDWQFFHENHAISGHAFTGAVPFIMAAKMSDEIWLKVLFYACSFMPAWSRINDGAHSLSQVGLGWYMAYLACECVETTERQQQNGHYVVAPILAPGFVGGYCVLKF